MENNERIREKYYEVKNATGLTYKKLAKMIGVPYNTLYKYMTLDRNPDNLKTKIILNALDEIADRASRSVLWSMNETEE